MATEMLKPVEWVGSSREDLKKLVKRRLQAAEQHYADTYGEG